MPKVCQISGKGSLKGNKRSHANNATIKHSKPNLQKKTLVNPATGEKMKLWVSTKTIKTLNRWNAEGKAYDLRELVQDV